MSNGNQEKSQLADLSLPIDDLLGELDGLLDSADAVSLRQSHKSVFLSFKQMLAYIDGIGEPKQEEIARLLQVYREMAKKFYTQYELSLLKEIRAQREMQALSEQVIARIRDLKVADEDNNTLRMAIPLVEKAGTDAELEYRDLLKNYPALMQHALDKLRDEWQRLYAIVTASAALTEDETLLRTLTAVATAAAISVEMEPGQILIVPGNVFALYFFSYLEKIAVLTVPIYSMRASWEWSIFWHELAGYKVRQLENDTIINEIRLKLTSFHERYKALEPSEKTTWLGVAARHRLDSKDASRKNEFSLNYLSQVFSGNQANLRDLGGFEHQYDQMLARVTRKNKLQSYEQIKEEGWGVDWFKELFEDAYSVLAIREPFLLFFKDVLRRHAVTDERHPPPHVRLSVAKELLKLMDPNSKIVNDPRLVEKAAAEQIMKFMSLLMASTPIFDETDANTSNPSELFTQMREMVFLYNFPDDVGTKIGVSIENWAANILESNKQAKSRVRSAEELIQEFSDQELTNTITYLKQKNQIKPSYDLLLAGKEYKQLLALSFYERDFFSSKGITNVCYNNNGVNSVLFPDTSDTDFIIDAFGLLVRTVTSSADGEVTFDFGLQKWATTRSNWNSAFPANSPFPNIKKYNIA